MLGLKQMDVLKDTLTLEEKLLLGKYKV